MKWDRTFIRSLIIHAAAPYCFFSRKKTAVRAPGAEV